MNIQLSRFIFWYFYELWNENLIASPLLGGANEWRHLGIRPMSRKVLEKDFRNRKTGAIKTKQKKDSLWNSLTTTMTNLISRHKNAVIWERRKTCKHPNASRQAQIETAKILPPKKPHKQIPTNSPNAGIFVSPNTIRPHQSLVIFFCDDLALDERLLCLLSVIFLLFFLFIFVNKFSLKR